MTAQDDEPPVLAAGVCKRFGTRTALDGLDLEVRPGEIVGLAGPNGSGKTTLLKLLAGFLSPDEGDVRLFGQDPFRQQKSVMRDVRFAFAPPPLLGSLTAREQLSYLARLGRRRAEVTRADVAATLALVGLEERADDRVETFSFGMRQRLNLAQALLPRPRLLVLDEPNDGLDPLAVIELRGILRTLRDEHGLAILLSSHLLIEVEELVDRLLVLVEGRTLFAGAPARLTAGRERILIEAEPRDAARELLAKRGIPATPEGAVALALPAGSVELVDVVELFNARGIRLESFRRDVPTLEAALLATLQGEVERNGRTR